MFEHKSSPLDITNKTPPFKLFVEVKSVNAFYYIGCKTHRYEIGRLQTTLLAEESEDEDAIAWVKKSREIEEQKKAADKRVSGNLASFLTTFCSMKVKVRDVLCVGSHMAYRKPHFVIKFF